jgi:hypothetical protein
VDDCPTCDTTCIEPHEDLPESERRWRHIQHTLAMCGRCLPRNGPTLDELRTDVLMVVREHEDAELEHAVDQLLSGEHNDWRETRAGPLRLLLDPAAECLRVGAPRDLAVRVQRLCSAYILSVGAAVTGATMFERENLCRRLPPRSQLAAAVRAMPPSAALDSDSDAEVWAGDSDSERLGPAHPGVTHVHYVPGAPLVATDSDSADELQFDARASAGLHTRASRGPSKRLRRRAVGAWPAPRAPATWHSDSDDEVALPARLPVLPSRPHVADPRPSKRVKCLQDRAVRVQLSAAPAAPPPAHAAGEADARSG